MYNLSKAYAWGCSPAHILLQMSFSVDKLCFIELLIIVEVLVIVKNCCAVGYSYNPE